MILSINCPISLLTINWLLLIVPNNVQSLTIDNDEAWEVWKFDRAKSYASRQEEASRRQLWVKEVEAVEEHNKAFNKGLESYSQAVYEWAVDQEYKPRTSYNSRNRLFKVNWIGAGNQSELRAKSNIPDQLDYRTMGYVTSVDDQKNCGVCWIISVVGAIEGLMKKTTGKLDKLSFQQILDCNEEGDGCNSGGYVDQAMKYAEMKGLQRYHDYPFVEKKESCKYNSAKVAFRFAKLNGKTGISESELKIAVATFGPVTVDIFAPRSFDRYKTDIYSTNECRSGQDPNHSVLIVGYGSDKASGKDYWIIKNSYGAGWGENGFMRFQRNTGLCSIGYLAIWPVAS